MQPSTSYQALLLLIGLSATPAMVQALEVPQFMPGIWEMGSTVRAKGKELLTVPQSSGGCVDPTALFKRDFAATEDDDGCKIKLISKLGSEYRYKVSCPAQEAAAARDNRLPVPRQIVIRTEDAKSFTQTVFFNRWTTVLSARRIGECEKDAQSGVGEK
jgi:hypothetical protein